MRRQPVVLLALLILLAAFFSSSFLLPPSGLAIRAVRFSSLFSTFSGGNNPLLGSSCFNGILDGTEQQIDCGGICPACQSSVTQYGITWTLSRPARVTQFANGDYAVTGDVGIQAITPNPLCATTTGRHGSMKNPRYGQAQGLDARAGGYTVSLCLAPTPTNPISLVKGDSLLSTISLPAQIGQVYLDSSAILTVTAQPTTGVEFRPAYTQNPTERQQHQQNNNALFTTNQIQWHLLPSLRRVAQTPALATSVTAFQRPWSQQFFPGFQNRAIAPRNNVPDYGWDIANLVSVASLQLLLDYTQQEKTPLMINFLQQGVDLWGIHNDGGSWSAGSGEPQGRKYLLLFSKQMLGIATPLKYSFRDSWGLLHYYFQEDGQTYLYNDPELPACARLDATGKPVGTDCSTLGAYPVRDEKGWIDKLNGGTGDQVLWRQKEPEYFDTHYEQLYLTRWSPDYQYHQREEVYRYCCTLDSWIGFGLATMLLNLQIQWEHPPFFAYVDRWMGQDDTEARRLEASQWQLNHYAKRQRTSSNSFVDAMWQRYRPTVGPACYNGICEPGETVATCSPDCGPTKQILLP